MRYLKTYTLFEGVKTKIILPAINERKSDRISMELSRFVVNQFKKREDFVMDGIRFDRGDEYATFDLSCVFIEDSDFNHPFSINASSAPSLPVISLISFSLSMWCICHTSR